MRRYIEDSLTKVSKKKIKLIAAKLFDIFMFLHLANFHFLTIEVGGISLLISIGSKFGQAKCIY